MLLFIIDSDLLVYPNTFHLAKRILLLFNLNIYLA